MRARLAVSDEETHDNISIENLWTGNFSSRSLVSKLSPQSLPPPVGVGVFSIWRRRCSTTS